MNTALKRRKGYAALLSLPITLSLGLAILSALTSVVSLDSSDAPPPPGPTIPHSPPQKASSSVDLRPLFEKWGLSPRRQGNRGACSVFAVTGALELAIAQKQNHGVRLSVEFLNWAGHKAAHRTVDGGFFSELWKGYETYGICPETDQPYADHFDAALEPAAETRAHAEVLRSLDLKLHWIKEWNPHNGLTDSQLAEIKATLAQQSPVCGGFRWPKQPVWHDHVLQMCPAEAVFDGHSILLVGYKDDLLQPGGGMFLIRNSGGNGSDGAMSYAYVKEFMNDAAWIGSEPGVKTSLPTTDN